MTRRATRRRIAPRRRLCAPAAVVALMLVAAAAPAGEIRAKVDAKEPIRKVWAVQRAAAQLKDSKGKLHDVGVYGKPYEGKVEGDTVVVENLPVPGTYDLRLETASGGVIAGWDAAVPESEYVGDPPLEEASKQKIYAKLADKQFSAFSDCMWVLDIRGNIQHAALLVMKLRMQPFVGGAYKPGEWVWRVERWHWENPDDQTWVPYQERPYYALVRERLYEKAYRAKRVAYARHLGGIALRQDRQAVNLGLVKASPPAGGVVAVNPDGSSVPPVVLKGAGAESRGAKSSAASSGGQSQGD